MSVWIEHHGVPVHPDTPEERELCLGCSSLVMNWLRRVLFGDRR